MNVIIIPRLIFQEVNNLRMGYYYKEFAVSELLRPFGSRHNPQPLSDGLIIILSFIPR